MGEGALGPPSRPGPLGWTIPLLVQPEIPTCDPRLSVAYGTGWGWATAHGRTPLQWGCQVSDATTGPGIPPPRPIPLPLSPTLLPRPLWGPGLGGGGSQGEAVHQPYLWPHLEAALPSQRRGTRLMNRDPHSEEKYPSSS